MRHRASRSLLSRIPLPDPARRRVVAAATLAVTAALTGVGVAVQQDDAAPTAARTPVTAELGTPSSSAPPTLSDSPSEAVSRGGDRKPQPSPTPSPSPSETSTPTVLPDTPTVSPEVGTPTASKAPTQTPSPSPDPPADANAPQTTASTSSVDSDSWTVAIGADEPASYECSLDGGAYRSCGATTTFSGLDHGPHSMSARATDTAGNTDPTPATLSTKVTGSG